MRISIRQLKQIIKEQVEESTKGGRIYDEEEDSGREPSEGRQVPFTKRKIQQELLTVEIKFFLEDEKDPDSIMYSFVQDTDGASGIDPVESLESMCEHWTAEAEDLARRLVDSNRE